MTSTSRRAVLRAGAGGVAALVGCLGRRADDPATRTTTTDEPTTTTDETTTTTDTTTTTEDQPTGPDEDRVAWTFDAGANVRLGPALAGDALYVGSEDGVLHALDPGDGSERWRFDTGRSFFSGIGPDGSPVAAGDAVYVVSGDQSGAHGTDFALFALDAASGEKRWSAARDYPSFLSLLGVRDGRVYAATGDDNITDRGENLLAFDAASGEQTWTAGVGDPRGAAVAADGVYVADFGGVEAFDPADGASRWTLDVPDPLDPIAAHGNVYAGTDEYQESLVHALDPASGDVRWTVDGWQVTSTLAGDALYVGGEHVAARAPDGSERWRYEPGGLLSDAALVGDALYPSGRQTAALDAATGEARWTFEPDAEFGVVEAATDEVVAVQRENSPVYDVLDAASGDVTWTIDHGTELSRPAAAGDTVYVADVAGTVYALA